jgi:hypothetical protein
MVEGESVQTDDGCAHDHGNDQLLLEEGEEDLGQAPA